MLSSIYQFFAVFFFSDTATTEIYTLSLHDALPISGGDHHGLSCRAGGGDRGQPGGRHPSRLRRRSEEHTSELQSQSNLVCRLLLEKKNQRITQVDRSECINYLNPTVRQDDTHR